jgi:hypothetical protein
MHDAARNYVAKFGTLDRIEIVDLGGRDLNGNVWGFWPNAAWWVVDLREGRGVDEAADLTAWRPGRQWDLAVCCEVFEHAEKWAEIVRTAFEVTRPGGRVIFTCAGPGRAPHSGIEATAITPDEYYQNVHPDELRSVMASVGFEAIECAQLGLDTQATALRPAAG